MVGRPEAGRSAVAAFVAHDIRVQNAEGPAKKDEVDRYWYGDVR